MNYDSIIVKRRRIISPANAFFSQETAAEEDPGNLLTNNKAFDHADWSKTGVTISANSTTDPDGGSLADTINEDTANSAHSVTQSVTKAASAISYDLLVRVKAIRPRVILQLDDGVDDGRYVTYDLSVPQVGHGPTGFGSAGWSGGTAEVPTSLGNSWYLCKLLGVTTSTETVVRALIAVDGNTGTNTTLSSFTGLDQASLYLHRAYLKVT
jgi:hypothetical protein